jgi:hypothetical protein
LQSLPALAFIIGHKTFEIVDGHRFIFQVAAALELTRMGANPAANQRQWVSLLDYPQGLKVISHGCLLELFGDVDPSGTGSLARSGAFLGGEFAQNAVRYRS